MTVYANMADVFHITELRALVFKEQSVENR